MIIGIDISQIVYEQTGVARYVEEMVRSLLEIDKKNTYVLFGSSLRKQSVFVKFFQSLPKDAIERTTLKLFPLPPSVLDFLWNTLHILPIEWLIGQIDSFWSSDWTQPPLAHAKGITTIHDLTIYRFPESFDKKIVAVHQRKLARSKKNCSVFLCDSEATKKDAAQFLHIPVEKLITVYPGYQL